MALPDMRDWSDEARQKAFDALEERDRLFGFNNPSNQNDDYDEEDFSRDFAATYADCK